MTVQFYTTKSSDVAPVALADMKIYLKVTTATDDTLIQTLINVATIHGEKYTRRSFRVQTFTLLLDAFADRIDLLRSPVDAVTFVKYLVSGSQVTVTSTVYWLKTLQQKSEILLDIGQTWPTDIDDREQAIEIEFTTTTYAQYVDVIALAIQRHVLYLYENRGDCGDIVATGEISGANSIYDQFRVARV